MLDKSPIEKSWWAAQSEHQHLPLPDDVEQVLCAALRLVDAEGLQALTMRRLAQDMGQEAIALYRYAPTRETVLEAVAELVMNELAIPDRDLDWQTQLRLIAHDFRRLALAHPHLVPLLVTRPLLTPLALRPLKAIQSFESFLQILTMAGFGWDEVLHLCRAYFGFLYGHVLTELHQSVVNSTATDHMLRLGLAELPADDYPAIHRVAADLSGYDGAADLDQGLDMLLAALAQRLATAGG